MIVDALEREKTVELRTIVVDLRGEKTCHKGIERACRCPLRRKNRSHGNRESLSMPFEEKKPVTWESRELVDTFEWKKDALKGIENDCRCP